MPSYTAQLTARFPELVNDLIANAPDRKHNVGAALLRAYTFDELAKLSKKASESAWQELDQITRANEPATPKPGAYELATSPHFLCKLIITKPVARFSAPALEDLLLKSKYKVPRHVTRELIEQAKKEGAGAKRYSIEEIVDESEGEG